MCSLVSDRCGELVTNFQSCRVLFCWVFLGFQFSVYSLPSLLPHVSPALCFLSFCPGAPGAVFCGFFTPAPLCALKKGASNSDVASAPTFGLWALISQRLTLSASWSDWGLDWTDPVPVYFLCLELRPPALFTGWVLCSETLSLNIWVEPAIESVFFPDTYYSNFTVSALATY